MLIPITLSYLGADLFGLWMVVTALTGMVAFADLGLGNGLMTKLAACCSIGDPERARCYISNAYVLLTAIAVGLCGLLWPLSALVPWPSVFNVTGSATPSDARHITLVCLTAFILNVPLSLVIRVQYAYQQVTQSNLWQAAGSALSVPLVLGATTAELSPIAVVAGTVAGPVVVNVVNSIWIYAVRMPELAPRIRYVEPGAARELFRLSGLFLALTIVMSLATNADMLIVAHALDLHSVTAYAVPARVCAVLGLLVSLLNVPMWPASGDALTQGHLDWIRRTTRRLTILSALSVFLASVLLVCGGPILVSFGIRGVSVGADRWLFVGLAAWWMLLAAISPRFMVQNAAGVVWPQLLGWTLYLVLSVVTKWYGLGHLGVTAVPYIGVAIYGLTVLPAALYGYRKAVAPDSRIRATWAKPSSPEPVPAGRIE
ncbi:oligosaccharide flippase family protein [Plantactinospora mayteni]|nr:oligosaccharide flippase family protein [Plantactinospora mayteni]